MKFCAFCGGCTAIARLIILFTEAEYINSMQDIDFSCDNKSDSNKVSGLNPAHVHNLIHVPLYYKKNYNSVWPGRVWKMLAYDNIKEVWQLKAKSQSEDVAVTCLNSH